MTQHFRGDDPPFIDEHQILVSAPALTVWWSLTTRAARLRPGGAEAFAYLVGAEPRRAAGSPFEEGATLPGFTVAEAVPGQYVRLTGRHRFSRYTLVLTLTTRPEGTMLSARTYAEFPGLHGWCYRQLVISSGAHRILLMRLLRAVRRHAENHRAH